MSTRVYYYNIIWFEYVPLEEWSLHRLSIPLQLWHCSWVQLLCTRAHLCNCSALAPLSYFNLITVTSRSPERHSLVQRNGWMNLTFVVTCLPIAFALNYHFTAHRTLINRSQWRCVIVLSHFSSSSQLAFCFRYIHVWQFCNMCLRLKRRKSRISW